MKTKKRFLSILISLMMVLGLMQGMSLTAFATVTNYHLSVGGTPVTSENAGNIDGYSKASYNADTNTLTLNGYSYDGQEAGVDYSGTTDLNIIITEENKITSTSYVGCIVGKGNLIFSGTGTLSLLNTSEGGSAIHNGKDITIESGTVIANNAQSGIRTEDGKVTIKGGTVTATGNSGIWAKKDVIISGGTVYAEGDSGTGISGETVTIQGGKVTATAKSTNTSGISSKQGTTISDGTVTATGGNGAISGPVKNAIPGTGWTDTAGAERKANIAISTEGRELTYKKVQFPGLPAASVTTAPAPKDLPYTGSAQELVTAGMAEGGEMQYALGTETKATDEYTTSIPKATVTGTYYVWYKAVGNKNHNDSEPASVKAAIEKAAPSITAPTARTLTYTGSAQALVTAGTTTGGTMQYALGNESGATEAYTISIPTKTDAGTYYVWYKVEGDDNYFGTEPVKVQVTISPTDKTGLNAAIAAAETYYNSIADNADYADIAETLKTAIETAKAVAENDNTTKSAVADAITALNGAVDAAKDDVKKTDEKKAAEAKKAADEAAAKKVVDLINALPANAGVGDKAAVDAARAACEALTEDQKKLVGEDARNKLDTAEAQVKAAEEEAAKQAEDEKEAEKKKAADEAAANSVIDLINALPENAGMGDKAAVEAARAAYDALSDDQKKLVGEGVLAKLTAAEQQVREAEEEARKVNISECKITVKDQTYTGKALKPAVTVKYGKVTLKKGTDYTVTYRDNVNPGTATATVKGKGNYTGSVEVTFAIRVPLSKCKLTVKDQAYTGKALKPAVTVKYGKTTLKKGADYTVTYKDNVKPGTATATVKGKGNYTGSAEITFAIRVPLSKCRLAVKDQTCTGKALKPAVTVKYGKTTLKKGTDYTVTYKDNVKAGTATATVKGKGNYTGSQKVTFKIVPKGTALSKLTGGNKQLTLEWDRQANITGYQIQYSLKSNFSGGKMVTVNKAGTVATTIKGLKAGKKYYVRIRTYATVKKVNYCSAWSKAKAVETASAKGNATAHAVELELLAGETLDLNALFPGGDAWASDDAAVVAVSEGFAKALAAGEAVVSGYDANGEAVSIVITVAEDRIEALEPGEDLALPVIDDAIDGGIVMGEVIGTTMD